LFFEGFWQTKLIDILPVRFNDYKIIYIKGLSLLKIPIFITYGSLLVYSDGLIDVLQLIIFVLITYILLTMSFEIIILIIKKKLIYIIHVQFNDSKLIYIKVLSLLNIPIFITYDSLLVYSDGLIGVLQLILFVLITYILLTMSLEKMINNMKQKLFNYHLELI